MILSQKKLFKIWKEISGRIHILVLNLSKKVSGTPKLYFETVFASDKKTLFKKLLFVCFNAEVLHKK